MVRKKVIDGDSPEQDIREEIRKEFDRWNEIAANGCGDPGWEDGVNMDLVRNHIIYWYRKLAERGLVQLNLFGEVIDERPVPPRVPLGYMVRGGKHEDRASRWPTNRRLVWGQKGEYRA